MRSVIDVILVNYPGRILFGFGGILQRRQFALAMFAILTTGGAGRDTWNAHTWYWK